jgi:hypothetical protein
MTTGIRTVLILAAAAFFISSCATQKAGEGGQVPEVVPVPQVKAEGQEPLTDAPDANPKPPVKNGDFVVSDELFWRTFEEIKAVVAELDTIIREKRYDAWLGHLSREYIGRTGSREFLEQASKSARLTSKKIVLASMEDYFVNVVVQSRLQTALDDIQFVDEANVKALTQVGGETYILYWLTREDGAWKIGVVQDR